MIIDAQVSYGVHARLKGRRKFDSYTLTEMHPMEVAEASAGDAPVAYWWHANSLRRSYRQHEVIKAKLAVRSFGGKLYQPLIPRDGDIPSVKADGAFIRGTKAAIGSARMIGVDNFKTMAARGALVAGSGFANFNPSRNPDINSLAPVAEIETNTRDSNIARFAEHYAKFLIVDGIVHAPTQSPVIDLELGHFQTFKLNERGWDHHNPQWVYCITRFEDAKKLFRQHQRPYETVDWKLMQPEIEDPSAIDFDETDFVLRLAARKLLEAMKRNNGSSRAPYLSNEPIKTMVAFGELRDALEGPDNVLVHEKLSGLANLVRDEGLYLTESRNTFAVIERLERDDMVPQYAPEIRACPSR